MIGVVWDYYCSKVKGKQCKQNTSPKNYETEIKILANPGLAQSGFEQPGPDCYGAPPSGPTLVSLVIWMTMSVHTG